MACPGARANTGLRRANTLYLLEQILGICSGYLQYLQYLLAQIPQIQHASVLVFAVFAKVGNTRANTSTSAVLGGRSTAAKPRACSGFGGARVVDLSISQ